MRLFTSRPSLAALALSTALLTAACSPAANVSPDTTVRARLDRETLQVILPLDDYEPSMVAISVTTRASLAIMRECLQKHRQNGLEPPPDVIHPGKDRPYGLWDVADASRNGFVGSSTPPSAPQPAPPGGWSVESSPEFQAAYSACSPEVGEAQAAVMLPDPNTSTNVLTALRREAYTRASDTPEWKKARDDWKACLRRQGLTPRNEDSAWTSQQTLELLPQTDEAAPDPARKAEEIRIAVIEATCNEQTQLTQKLGDLEAGYQAALIKGKEAQLEKEKAENQKYVDAARAYLASHQ